MTKPYSQKTMLRKLHNTYSFLDFFTFSNCSITVGLGVDTLVGSKRIAFMSLKNRYEITFKQSSVCAGIWFGLIFYKTCHNEPCVDAVP